MDFLGWMEHAWIGGDAKVRRQETVIEGTPVPDVSDDAGDWDQEHQRIEQLLGNKRRTPVELTNKPRQAGQIIFESFGAGLGNSYHRWT